MKRFAHIAFLAVIAPFLLVGCGEKQIENLAAVCEQLRDELMPLETITLLGRDLHYDGDSVAMLLGDQTRSDNKKFIYEQFPFMRSYSIAGIQSGEYEKGLKSYKIQAALHFFSQTSNPVILDPAEEEIILKTSDDGFDTVIEPKVFKIIGEPYSDDGCVGLDSENEVEYSLRVEELFKDGISAAEESKNQLLGILLCERDGEIEGTKCDKFDFEPSDYPTSNEPTEEELEILAEREADAERDSQGSSGSSGYSDVTPLQLCGSLGAVVQTENYGQLTCKYVFINRVRALAWMR
jgi:hypothetical protein